VYESPPYDTAFPWPHNKIEALLNFMHSSAGGQMPCFQSIATSVDPSLSKSYGKKAGLFPSIHAKFLLRSPVINRKIRSRSHDMVSPTKDERDAMKRSTRTMKSGGLDDKYLSRSPMGENVFDDDTFDGMREEEEMSDHRPSGRDIAVNQSIFKGSGELLLFDPTLRSYQPMGKAVLTLQEDGERGFALRVQQKGSDLALCKLVHALAFRLTLSPQMHERCLDVLEGGEDGHDPLARWTSSRKLAEGTRSSRDVQFIDQSSRVFSFHMDSENDWEEYAFHFTFMCGRRVNVYP
jgi:hypothetical protein